MKENNVCFFNWRQILSASYLFANISEENLDVRYIFISFSLSVTYYCLYKQLCAS